MRLEPPVPAPILAEMRTALEAVGAERVEAPLLQPLNLLLDLAGEAMRARLLVVQSEGSADCCLRPDFTVAISRQHIESGRQQGRYSYQGPAFRASGGSDRAEEFVQLGIEIFAPAGNDAAAADAEVASLAWRAALVGGRGDLSLHLGDVALFGAFVESLGLPEALAGRLTRLAGRPRLLAAELSRVDQARDPSGVAPLAALLAGLSEPQAVTMLEEVWALAGVAPVGGRGPAEIAARLIRKSEAAQAPALTTPQADAIKAFMGVDDSPRAAFDQVRALAGRNAEALMAALAAWQLRLTALESTTPADRMAFAPALGHAFDYYDGLTFEVRSAALGRDRPVAVGGRYDGLLGQLGGLADQTAIGCMVRPWRAWNEGGA